MSFPLINPQPQFFDSAGSPLASGTIEFKDPVADTYINSYPTAADADAQTNANANPLTLNARGEAESGLYLEDGVKYKIILREEWPDELTPGNIVWTQTNVLCPIALPYQTTAAEDRLYRDKVPSASCSGKCNCLSRSRVTRGSLCCRCA